MNYKKLISNINGRFLENEPLKKYTHYEIGGKVDLFAFPKTIEECATLIKNCKIQEIPYFIFGKGSNLLISDEGFRGVFISLDDWFVIYLLVFFFVDISLCCCCCCFCLFVFLFFRFNCLCVCLYIDFELIKTDKRQIIFR